MRKVKCHDCGRSYDYDVDDFCPKCGAFTLPQQESHIGADGTVIRNDGINEQGHHGSFVHQEYHAENRKRSRTRLEAKLPKVAVSLPKKRAQMTAARGRMGGKKRVGQVVAIVIFFLYLLIQIMR